MPYYRTIEEDLERAKQILREGKADAEAEIAEHFDDDQTKAILANADAGTIYGKDTYAAYKLLESFVDKIEKDRFYYRDLEEAMRRVAKEVKGAPSMILRDLKPYKVIPEELADWIEKLV